MSDAETPTVGAPAVALPGPHPHKSADFEDWGGINRDEKRSRTITASPAGDADLNASGDANPGPHPHTSEDFKEWGGEHAAGRPTRPDVVRTLQGEVRVLGSDDKAQVV